MTLQLKKIAYERMPIRITIVELFKKLLFKVYRGKEKNQVLANTRS